MKIKIPFWDGKFNCEVYDMKSKPLYLPSFTDSEATPHTTIPKASHVKGLIQCTGIWFAVVGMLQLAYAMMSITSDNKCWMALHSKRYIYMHCTQYLRDFTSLAGYLGYFH